jgi:hypothetical protein
MSVLDSLSQFRRKPDNRLTLAGLDARLTKQDQRILALEKKSEPPLVGTEPVISTQTTRPAAITVSTMTALVTALDTCRGGEIIEVSTTLGVLKLQNRTFAEPVTIAGGTLRGLDLRHVEGLTFDGVMLDYVFAEGNPTWIRPFQVLNSKSIKFTNCRFDGDNATMDGAGDLYKGYPCGSGLFVDRTSGLTVSNSRINGFFRGIELMMCDAVTVEGNTIEDIFSDGMVCPGTVDLLIKGNTFRNFRRPLDTPQRQVGTHPDMIQFWTAGDISRASRNVKIIGNTFDMGTGMWTQTIFMRNEKVDRGEATFEAMAYRNIEIADNKITNNHVHGMMIGEADNVRIYGNTVVPRMHQSKLPDAESKRAPYPWISIAAACSNVSVTNNTARVSPEKYQPGNADPYATGDWNYDKS